MYSLLPIFLGTICSAGIIWDSRRKVMIDADEITYSAILGGFRVRLREIQKVWVSNGYIVIDDGSKPRKVIPLMFENTGLIIAMLEKSRVTP